ncbi:MAG: transposase, partial [Alphaproteobacteria bacterium]
MGGQAKAPKNIYKHPRWIPKNAGIVPKHKQSGSSVRGQSRLSNIGSSRLRNVPYFPVLVAKQYNPVLAHFWERLTHKGKSKVTAVGTCMRKLLHIIFGV